MSSPPYVQTYFIVFLFSGREVRRNYSSLHELCRFERTCRIWQSEIPASHHHDTDTKAYPGASLDSFSHIFIATLGIERRKHSFCLSIAEPGGSWRNSDASYCLFCLEASASGDLIMHQFLLKLRLWVQPHCTLLVQANNRFAFTTFHPTSLLLSCYHHERIQYPRRSATNV